MIMQNFEIKLIILHEISFIWKNVESSKTWKKLGLLKTKIGVETLYINYLLGYA